ncbi:DUF268 domain-containing protein [Leptolyngbya sp. CCNP1308]|uniref:DUF268 domain-containing protein n=1 Tax=Leptolyngbya sp. CCNP1308 TaxID=3110255 RepID=UPI002B209193|nr:DUF268 domain-containing protein [Leptolyngbya sp. CCNP1308]MEA5452263.1 DUF268 domain-containing protein [Leptolyngbya sp. CCNP1308]
MIQEALWILRRQRYKYSPRAVSKSLLKNIGTWQRFWKSYHQYRKAAGITDSSLLQNFYPCIGEDTTTTTIEPTYFYQDTWAFERIVNRAPKQHIDVGSHHKFVAFLSKILPVTMVDIRPLSLPLESLKFQEGSILDLPFKSESISSLSSLCVVEHIGLGRYGDPLDPSGSEKAIAELCRVLAPGGYLYLSIPVGDQDITAFNAGRIFNIESLKKMLSPLIIIDSSFIVEQSLSKNYCHTKNFGTTGLFEIFKPYGA